MTVKMESEGDYCPQQPARFDLHRRQSLNTQYIPGKARPLAFMRKCTGSDFVLQRARIDEASFSRD